MVNGRVAPSGVSSFHDRAFSVSVKAGTAVSRMSRTRCVAPFGTFNSAPAVSLHDYGIHIPLRRRATSSLGDDAMSDRASAAEAGYLQLARKYRSSLVGSPFSLISGPQSVGYSLLMSPDGLRLFLESVSCSDLSPDGDFVVGSGATLVAMNAVAALDGSEAKRMAWSHC